MLLRVIVLSSQFSAVAARVTAPSARIEIINRIRYPIVRYKSLRAAKNCMNLREKTRTAQQTIQHPSGRAPRGRRPRRKPLRNKVKRPRWQRKNELRRKRPLDSIAVAAGRRFGRRGQKNHTSSPRRSPRPPVSSPTARRRAAAALSYSPSIHHLRQTPPKSPDADGKTHTNQ